MPLEPQDEDALKALFAGLRSKHGDRVDDVLALWLLSFPQKPSPGSLSGRIVDEFMRRAAAKVGPGSGDGQLLATYFQKHLSLQR